MKGVEQKGSPAEHSRVVGASGERFRGSGQQQEKQTKDGKEVRASSEESAQRKKDREADEND